MLRNTLASLRVSCFVEDTEAIGLGCPSGYHLQNSPFCLLAISASMFLFSSG
jgi:hypothetical protein